MWSGRGPQKSGWRLWNADGSLPLIREILMTDRREFLQASAAVAGTMIVSPSFSGPIPGGEPPPKFVMFYVLSDEWWPTEDPVQWAATQQKNPLLSRVANRLLGERTQDDWTRIIGLFTRRFAVNLVELRPGRVILHYWGKRKVDLKYFMRSEKLARPDIEVCELNRKLETIVRRSGEDFLSGSPMPIDFELDLFRHKWNRRFEQEANDSTEIAVDHSRLGRLEFLCWPGLPNNAIPWSAMKSAWRNDLGLRSICPNCDKKMILVDFGGQPFGFCKYTFFTKHLCVGCQRMFLTDLDNTDWITAHLDPDVMPEKKDLYLRNFPAKSVQALSPLSGYSSLPGKD
jgi:hypothetical protein